MLLSFFLAFLTLIQHLAWAQQATTCSATHACLQGCCSKYGSCGFGPDFCGDGCQGTCNAIAECGEYGNTTTCPLNVCCSQYGFCGTTANFCGTGCQNGCDPVPRPTCGEDTNAMKLPRRIAYYELFGLERGCDIMEPETIATGALTHINLAFQLIGEDFKITDTRGDIVARVSRLKKIYPTLRVMVAVGGWTFNDPPTQTRFSDMVSSVENQQTFISSVISYLQKYGLDGIDVDWEYPVASDRGGIPTDYDTYPVFLSNMREAFDQVNPGWDITITLPSSYWYLRGFNLPSIQKYVSWFNFMSYDLHGMWDKHNQFTGPYLLGHTNITEIDIGLDLLWRNQVDPKNVVMGFSFYGRSFTMADPACSEPNGVCEFATAGIPGSCSATAGILIYAEIQSVNTSLNVQTLYDKKSTVKYNIFDSTQWVSYDDEQSFMDKKKFLSSRCLNGLMIWALDQDDQQYNALTGLLGEKAMQGSLLQGGDLDDGEKTQLAGEFAAYTGQKCFVTKVCTDGSKDQLGPDQTCPKGTSSVSTAHAPEQAIGKTIQGDCSKGWYRHICCPTSSMPQNCKWNGAPVHSEFGCSGGCGNTQFQLNIDPFFDPFGAGQCYQGKRTLCCDSTELFDECFWTPCQGPILTDPECPSGTRFMTYRYDDDNGQYCSESEDNSPVEKSFKRAFCCPIADAPSNCSWSNDPNTPPGQIAVWDPQAACQPQLCDRTQVQYTTALNPPDSQALYSGIVNVAAVPDCAAYPIPVGQSPYFPYCCNPPEAYNERWPVDPKYLWQDYYDATGDDVQWSYADNYGNNNADTSPSDTDGDDPYGFVMLDGPPGSIENSFASDFTVARRTAEIAKAKRSWVTTNRTILDQVFEPMSETIYVYCNHPKNSPKCAKVFHKGAEDTIITLPAHVGEGPFARIVSMEPAIDYELPNHHLRARAVERNTHPVYKLTFDYSFHLSKRASNVNMRVDYTNLLSYWKTVTNTPASKKKRSVLSDSLPYQDWRAIIRDAKQEHQKLSKRHSQPADSLADKLVKRDPTGLSTRLLEKRWFGSFVNWLTKLMTVESSNKGFLAMAWRQSMLLYHAVKGCQQSTAYAEISMYLDSDIEMDITFAYYFSGSLTGITDTFAYVGIEPSAYLGLRIDGLAKLQYTSDRVKLIDTLSWPGLAIKGIAAVGPTLDVWGQLQSIVQLNGQMQVGVRFKFEQQEWYWPDNADISKYNELLDLQKDPEPVQQGIVPAFFASVAASADLNVLVTPEANLGIKIGTSGLTLVNAQIVGYVNTTLNLHADVAGTVSTSSGHSYSYNYGAYLYYNIGYGAVASLVGYNWYAKRHDLYSPPKVVTLYHKGDVSSSSAASKRDVTVIEGIKLPRRGLLNSINSAELQVVGQNLPRSEPVLQRRADELDLSPANYSVDVGHLLRRQNNPNGSPGTGQQPEFSLSQLFDCPENSGCSCSTCGSTTPGDQSTTTTRSSTRDLVTRAQSPTSCGSTLPDFRINCGIFSNVQVNGNGNTQVIPGICQNEQDFFRRRAMINTGLVLTFDSDTNRANGRRTFSCSRGRACITKNTIYGAATGFYSLTSCDEFPFASVEEGGNYFGSLPQNPSAIGVSCTPVWQQDIQSRCNQIFGTLSTNVLYADTVGSGNVQTNWVQWNDAAWTSGLNPNGGFNRLATYPGYVYQAGGVPNAGYTASGGRTGYMFKRNFTYGLAFPSTANDGNAWGTQPFQRYTSTTDQGPFSSTDATTVLCAMNIFGQNQIYRYGSYNGLCINPHRARYRSGYGDTPAWVNCKVTFAGSNGPTKRSVGTFGGWEVESVEIEEDAEPEGYIPREVNLTEQMPVTIVSSSGKKAGLVDFVS